MLPPRKVAVKFNESDPYQRDGKWYVLVTIDNSNEVERLAAEDEIPKVESKAKPK